MLLFILIRYNKFVWKRHNGSLSLSSSLHMSYRHFSCSFNLPFYLKICTIVWKNSCTYAGTKLCLNDHYLCETFSLGWTIHHCNITPMWGLISLLVLIEHLPQLAWMPTYGTAIRDFRHQRAVTWSHCYDMSLAVTAPCHAGVTSKTMCERQSCPTWLLALAGSTTNGQLAMILYITWL